MISKKGTELQHDFQKSQNLAIFLEMSTVDFNAFWILFFTDAHTWWSKSVFLLMMDNLLHDWSLERIDIGIYFSIKLFLGQFFEENVKGEKSLNFVILEISCCTLYLSCLSKSYFIVPFVIFLNAHVSGSNIFKGF